MSMEINSAYSSYAATASSAPKNDSAASESKQYNNADEYAKYLSEKYDYFGKQAPNSLM